MFKDILCFAAPAFAFLAMRMRGDGRGSKNFVLCMDSLGREVVLSLPLLLLMPLPNCVSMLVGLFRCSDMRVLAEVEL